MSRRRTQRVLIDGIETPVLEFHTSHDVDRPVGTGSLKTVAPRRSYMQLGSEVVIQAGYDGAASTIFRGRIANDAAAFSESGGELRIALEGHGKRLWYKQYRDLVIPGSNSLRHIFIVLCRTLGVPLWFADRTLGPSGALVQFGGNPQIDGGAVIVERDGSAGQLLDRFARYYGYRIFDRPDGYLRLQKISGLPVGAPVMAYEQGVNVLEVSQVRTLDGMANYFEVLGAEYTDVGGPVAVRSIPATVPFDERLGPSGVNRVPIDDQAILTVERAHDIRNAQETDRSTPQYRWTWTGTGDPARMPGEVVSVTSPTVGSNTSMWLMRVSHDGTESEWTTTMEGWAGAGTAQPAGDDCVTQTLVGAQGFHIGNETLAHYRNPAPAGLQKKIPFTVLDNYSTLTIRYDGHGCNSFQGNATSTASRFEIWQTVNGEYKRVAEGEMPRQDENLEQQYPYGTGSVQLEDGTWVTGDYFWQEDIAVPLEGSLIAGDADLLMIAGYDSTVGDYDDYEIKNVRLTTCGVGEPVVIL